MHVKECECRPVIFCVSPSHTHVHTHTHTHTHYLLQRIFSPPAPHHSRGTTAGARITFVNPRRRVNQWSSFSLLMMGQSTWQTVVNMKTIMTDCCLGEILITFVPYNTAEWILISAPAPHKLRTVTTTWPLSTCKCSLNHCLKIMALSM